VDSKLAGIISFGVRPVVIADLFSDNGEFKTSVVRLNVLHIAKAMFASYVLII
jgi:hypothetical protein